MPGVRLSVCVALVRPDRPHTAWDDWSFSGHATSSTTRCSTALTTFTVHQLPVWGLPRLWARDCPVVWAPWSPTLGTVDMCAVQSTTVPGFFRRD